MRSLAGAFSREVEALTRALTELRLHVEAAIDFPEEEIDFLSDRQLKARIDACRSRFAELTANAEAGRLLADGYQIVIAGPPNAGKSSLLNRLCGQDAAIVTARAGTTRDILRERVNLDGLAVEFVDTAGLRDGLRDDRDLIEAEGIRRARAELERADAALWIEDAGAAVATPAALPPDLPVLLVRNKIDLTGESPGAAARGRVNISAKTGAGLDALMAAVKVLTGYRETGQGAFSARRRHLDALECARQRFDTGVTVLESDQAGELFAEELRLAQRALAEITGEVSSDDLLGRIFSEFCIGK